MYVIWQDFWKGGSYLQRCVCGGGDGGFALLILSHFTSISHETEMFGLTKTKLFHFHVIFKIGGECRGFQRIP